MRVRVPGIRMDDPTLRSPAAHDAAQKHLAAIARDGVVVPGHVAVNPAPHKSPFRTPIAAEWQGRCQLHGRLPCMKTCAESKSLIYSRIRSRDCGLEVARAITLWKSSFRKGLFRKVDERDRGCRCPHGHGDLTIWGMRGLEG